MNKATKSRIEILKFLPRAASVVSFQSPPFSPNRRFSGPAASLVPHEARRKNKKDDADHPQEPSSPKVSCMGQIKSVKKKINQQPNRTNPVRAHPAAGICGGAGEKGAAESGNLKYNNKQLTVDHKAPSLGKLNRFASGRGSFANLDWTTQIIPVDSDH